jgi:hypothetical protein
VTASSAGLLEYKAEQCYLVSSRDNRRGYYILGDTMAFPASRAQRLSGLISIENEWNS